MKGKQSIRVVTEADRVLSRLLFFPSPITRRKMIARLYLRGVLADISLARQPLTHSMKHPLTRLGVAQFSRSASSVISNRR